MSEGKKQAPDWERIEADYRAGILSLREIADGSGVSHVSISKRAKREGWDRNIAAKAQAKADSLVNKAEVNRKVNSETAVNEKVLIEATAQVIADIRLAHRGDIRKAKDLSLLLLEELSSQTIERELYENLGELLRSEDEKGMDKLNDLYMKVIGTPSRIVSMEKLANTLKTLIGLEREAYSIKGDAQEVTVTHKEKPELTDPMAASQFYQEFMGAK